MLKKQSDQLSADFYSEVYMVTLPDFKTMVVWDGKVRFLFGMEFFQLRHSFCFEAGWIYLCFPYILTGARQDRCASTIHARCLTKPCVYTSYCPNLTNFVLV